MSGLADTVPGLDSATSTRFSLVSYLPTYAAVVYLAFVLAGGAPADHFDLHRAGDRLDALGGVDLAAITLGVVLVAVVLQPLQRPLVQLLEGYWPRWMKPLSKVGISRQRRRRKRLAQRADTSRLSTEELAERGPRQAVLEAAWELRRRFPPNEIVLPTALGNMLRAMENDAGSSYGADTVAWWPRLYVVLGDQARGIVDDRRNQLDATCRLAATCAVLAVISVPLLATSGWWLAVAFVPLAAAIVSYRAALAAAMSYGESVRMGFDLHRFDLLARLHLPLPANITEELAQNGRLTQFWLQGVPMSRTTFDHGGHPD